MAGNASIGTIWTIFTFVGPDPNGEFVEVGKWNKDGHKAGDAWIANVIWGHVWQGNNYKYAWVGYFIVQTTPK